MIIDGAQIVRADFGLTFAVGLIMSVGLTILSDILRKPQGPEPPSEGDFDVSTATEDRHVPLLWGRDRMNGLNCTWWRFIGNRSITQKVGLIFKKSVTTGYKPFLGMQMSICRGGETPVTLEKLYIGDREVADATTGFVNQPEFFGGDEDGGSGGLFGVVEFFDGNLTQTAPSYLETFYPVVPGYRGQSYLLFQDFNFGNSTRVPQIAVEGSRYPNALQVAANAGGIYLPGEERIGLDLNPAEVFYETITESTWGNGRPSSDVNIDNFAAAARKFFDEGLGFSFHLDRPSSPEKIREIVEKHTNSIAYQNRVTGLWEINVTRGVEDVTGLTEILDEDIIDVVNFSRQTWDGTANQLWVSYTKRTKNYKKTSQPSYSQGNTRSQSGRTVGDVVEFPGVREQSVAQKIAATELRQRSYPLSSAQIVVTRKFSDVNRGDVLSVNIPEYGQIAVPMKVIEIDLGASNSARITLDLVQDVFSIEDGLFDSSDSLWEFPDYTVGAIPLDEQVLVEAPKGLIQRSDAPDIRHRLFAAFRAQTTEVAFDLFERVGADPFEDGGDGNETMRMGSLSVPLAASSANPVPTLDLVGSPDSAAFTFIITQDISASTAGQALRNLILVGNEFMVFEGVTVAGNVLTLTNVYRGILDSYPEDHGAGQKVALVYTAPGGIGDTDHVVGTVVDAQIRSRSRAEVLSEADAVTVSVPILDRYNRPYPPIEPVLNGTRYNQTPDMDNQTGATNDSRGINLTFFRRDYNNTNEVEALTADASTLPGSGGFPLLADEFQPEASKGPVRYSLHGFAPGAIQFIGRSEILAAANGVVGPVSVGIRSKHTLPSGDLESLRALEAPTTPTSALIGPGDLNLGTLVPNAHSAAYTPAGLTLHTLTIARSLSANVEVSTDGGATFSNLITAGSLSGTFTPLAGQAVHFRHLDTTGPDATFGELDDGAHVGHVIIVSGTLDKMVGYWPLAEFSDGTGPVDRERGVGTLGALSSTGNPPSGLDVTGFGPGARCGGGAQYLSAATADLQHFLPLVGLNTADSPFTAMIWIEFAPGSLDNTERLFLGAENMFELGVNAGNQAFAKVHNNANGNVGPQSTAAVTLQEGVRYLVAVSRATSNYRVYVVEAHKLSTEGNLASNGSGLGAPTSPFVVGAGTDAGVVTAADSILDATLSNLRIYRKALSKAEIEAIAAERDGLQI